MSMIQSLNTGTQALKSFERGLAVVGHDIANVNTVGFKNQRIEYKESFYDTLNRSYSGNGNPSFGVTSTANQVGGGVQGNIISTNFNQGQLDVTAVDTDVAILGDGFFRVSDESNANNIREQYTRAGNFRLDGDGYLVTQEGKFVQGLTFDETSSVSMTVAGTSDGQGIPADGFEVTNLDTSGALAAGTALTLPGTYNGGSGYYSTTNGAPKVTILGDGAGAEATATVTNGVVTGVTITKAGSGYTRAVVRIEEPPANNLQYTVTTQPTLSTTPNKIKVDLPTINLGTITDTSTLTAANAATLQPKLQTFNIQEDGEVQAVLENGETLTIGKLLLQRFKAPQNLTRVEGGYYENVNAAVAENTFDGTTGIPGTNALGVLRQGSLELSNTDLTENFSNLITTQRSFQGAARIITTSDEVLREAVNLKR